MSMESAKAFLTKMKTDPEFAAKVIKCKNKEERTQFVTAAGYDFVGAELNTLRIELSDNDLDQVTGGEGCEWEPYFRCQSFCQNNMEVHFPE